MRKTILSLILSIACFAVPILAQDELEGEVLVAPRLYNESVRTNQTSYRRDKPPGAKIRGRLVYEDTGRPMRFIGIRVVPVSARNSGRSEEARTDRNGEFVVRDVAQGKYLVEVLNSSILKNSDYVANVRVETKSDNPKDKPPSDVFEVEGGGEVLIAAIARRGAVIKGRVTFNDGEVAIGIKLEALRKEGDSYFPTRRQVTTDDNGEYRLTGLRDGKYLLRISEPANHVDLLDSLSSDVDLTAASMLTSYYGEDGTLEKAKEVEVGIGENVGGIDVQLVDRELFSIAGRVVKKADGSAVADMRVSIAAVGKNNTYAPFSEISVSTDKTGTFDFLNLPSGKYAIKVERRGYLSDDEKKAEKFAVTTEIVEIAKQNVADFEIRLASEAKFSGTVTVEGVQKWEEYWKYNLKPTLRNAETKADTYSTLEGENEEEDESKPQSKQPPNIRAFSAGGLKAGKYLMVLQIPKGLYLKSATLGGRDLMAEEFEIKEGENLTGVKIVFSNGVGNVTGRVEPANLPKTEVFLAKAGTTVSSRNDLTKLIAAKLNPDGTFSVTAPPGDYVLAALSMQTEIKTWEAFFPLVNAAIGAGTKVTVKPKETVTANVTAVKN